MVKVVTEVDDVGGGGGRIVVELVTTVWDPLESVVVRVVTDTEPEGEGGRVVELVTVEISPLGRVVG